MTQSQNPAIALLECAQIAFPDREVDEAAFAKAFHHCENPMPGPVVVKGRIDNVLRVFDADAVPDVVIVNGVEFRPVT